uniref:1-Cys peroxiredoxin n=1 Tax=Xenopsylla cheopis TaxID=163159 RepID=A0A6M2DLZ8_XENCH
MVNLGETFPNYSLKTTIGDITFHDYVQNSWGILFSHPADFTPVCTTELARVVKLMPEFEKRNVKVIALSCDNVETHLEWSKDILSYAGEMTKTFPYPIIDDSSRELAVKLRMIDPDEKDKDGMPMTARAVFVVDPKKKLRLSILYPATTGRNFDEILRVIDSLQMTDKNLVATPADWKAGQECMILPNVKQEDIPTLFPGGMSMYNVPSGKKYMRLTPCPKKD